MRKLILAMLLMYPLLNVCAQDIATAVEKSEFKTKNKDEIFLTDVLELPGNEKLAVFKKYSGAIVLVHKYDAEGKLIREVKLEPNLINNTEGGHVFIFNNSVYIIYIGFANSDKLELHVNSASVDNLAFKDTVLLDFNTTRYAFINSQGIRAASSRNTFLNTIVSKDKSHFVVYYSHPNDKNMSRSHRLFLIDVAKKNVVFEHNYNKEDEGTVFFYQDIDYQDGKIYALANARPIDELDFKVYLQAQKISSNGIKRVKFEQQEKKWPNRLAMAFDKDYLKIGGFYGNKYDVTSGICYFDIEPESMTVKNSKYDSFTSQFYIDKFDKDKPKDIKGLQDIGKLLILDNGDIVLTGESVERESYKTGGFTMNYYDIIVGRISSNGDLKWIRNIKKNQKNGDGRYGLSYAAKAKREDLYLFINAEKLNGDESNPVFKHADYDHSSLYVVKLDSNGKMDYKKILDVKQRIVEPNPQYCVDAPEGDAFYIFGQDDYNRIFAKIKL